MKKSKMLKKCRACQICWNHQNKLCPVHTRKVANLMR